MKRLKTVLRRLVLEHMDVWSYLFFGGLTTLINLAAYFLLYEKMGVANVPATGIAWVLSVVFAYLTNKLWVFRSRSFAWAVVRREIVSFFGCRIATGALDVGIMYLAVDKMGWNGTLWKLISNGIVVILNYAASRILIFRKRDSGRY